MVKTAHSNAGGVGSIPGREAKIPHASGPKTPNIEERNNVVMNSIKTLKMVHIKKILKKIKRKTALLRNNSCAI